MPINSRATQKALSTLKPVLKDKWVQRKGKTLLYKILYEQGFACDDKDTHFELVTGYVYTAPDDMLDSRPGTLMLTDCIELCRRNSTCKSANFETGLCVLFGSSAADFPGKKDWPFFLIIIPVFPCKCMFKLDKYPVGFRIQVGP